VRRASGLELVYGLIAVRETVNGHLCEAVAIAHAEGVNVLLLANILGMDRSTVYRRYLSSEVDVDGLDVGCVEERLQRL
jgi:hypothetical protein